MDGDYFVMYDMVSRGKSNTATFETITLVLLGINILGVLGLGFYLIRKRMTIDKIV